MEYSEGILIIFNTTFMDLWSYQLSQYSVWLGAGRPGDRGSIPGRGKEFFLYPLCPDRLWGPPSLLYNGYRGSFPRGKEQLGREADHSPPSSAEVGNE
jgi:hypothetical protein